MATDIMLTTISIKGQIILPKAILDQLQWEPGTRLSVEHTPDGVLLRPITAPFPSTDPAAVFGSLDGTGPSRTLEEMDAAILAEAARCNACG